MGLIKTLFLRGRGRPRPVAPDFLNAPCLTGKRFAIILLMPAKGFSLPTSCEIADWTWLRRAYHHLKFGSGVVLIQLSISFGKR